MAKKQWSIPILGFVLFVLMGCKQEKKAELHHNETVPSSISYAKGFTVTKEGDITLIEVTAAWPGAKSFTYALVPKQKLASTTFPRDAYDAIIGTPVENIVLTSTTHMEPIIQLGELNAVVGFPNTDYISSPAARERIAQGAIKDLGMNDRLNTEMVLELNPELIVGFSINEDNNAYDIMRRAGIPVAYNGDWVEQSPLGKAEWVKFFAPFFQKETLGDSIFAEIEASYRNAKELAQKATSKPTVLTGGLYKDVWYVAGGKSWMAQFLEDANADYLWANTAETGSIGLSLETVLAKAQNAEFWFNPSAQITYDELAQANTHHMEFDAFKNKKVYSNAIDKGEKGGLIFYETAPQHPDIVLKDLIKILHPALLPEHQLQFIKPLP
ncbi:MAG: ABC transporter substrate-binding protein [Muricauda sp.]|jgi:iron complex transport system substrate-binding protein|nr:ABC transporter substrate-binding protein [Allomuricauda sp.]MBO6531753.1 ABC transporter substrate-binding protein [Allomuricauda sp.]MBO6589019.1 ABC transporter substrate-binding protein [Allomuricauda sp.]MBO6618644.1 ABC transporter substrate-binding protein [Allomuricauda sp.]MBO6644557.1 ABC transporter substrate-binding protein [Allomuricauda sp.]MBO6746457.1 ABC transporter substrate-binding protein [Allomuricauda sp.]